HLTYSRRAVRARLAWTTVQPAADTATLLRAAPKSRLPFFSALPFSPTANTRLQLQLDQAGWAMTPGELTGFRVVGALGGAVVGMIVGGFIPFDPAWIRFVLAAAITLAGWFAPRVILARSRS